MTDAYIQQIGRHNDMMFMIYYDVDNTCTTNDGQGTPACEGLSTSERRVVPQYSCAVIGEPREDGVGEALGVGRLPSSESHQTSSTQHPHVTEKPDVLALGYSSCSTDRHTGHSARNSTFTTYRNTILSGGVWSCPWGRFNRIPSHIHSCITRSQRSDGVAFE